MAVVLEIKSGPFTGKTLNVVVGSSLTIGRAPDRAQFAVLRDNHMSGIHFAVECGPNGCHITDRKDTRYLFCLSVRER